MSAQTFPKDVDTVVIGAGPGGYVAAIRAAQSGQEVALVERDAYGGTCLNVGCIPSKALIAATDVAYHANNAERMGIHGDVAVDFGGMIDWKDGVVKRLTGGIEKLCNANGVMLVDGVAEFASERAVRIRKDGRERGSIAFDSAVIATGSRPIRLPGVEFDGEHVLSSTDVLKLGERPGRLLVVGAGYIGMELSTVLAKAGVDVTVIEMLDRALPEYERDVARIVRRRAEEFGVEFRFGEGATDWTPIDGGTRLTTETEAGERSEYEADAVVVAVGREPVTDTIDPGNAGIDTDERGFIRTDERTRTSTDGIFAVGDVAGEPMLAHKASNEGEIAADVITGNGEPHTPAAIPAAVFTDPEICTIGMTQADAKAAEKDPAVGRMPMRASGRALTIGETEGFVRIVADGTTGTILGAQIVGPEASELGAEISVAIEMGATAADVARTVHTHPTLGEAVMEAAANARNEAIHTLNE